MVTVRSGANSADVEFAGKTVGQARQELAEALNISADARATLGGKAVDDDYTLRNGDSLVFTKQTAEKGF